MNWIKLNRKISVYCEHIIKLSRLIRYNNKLRIKDESVGEHQNFVTLVVFKLHEYYKFNLSHAIIMAAVHDVGESIISDIPYDVKKRFPKVKHEIHHAEMIACIDIDEKIVNYIAEYDIGESTESKIVKLADLISVYEYTKSEISLGNSNFDSINSEVCEGISKVISSLQENRRCQD